MKDFSIKVYDQDQAAHKLIDRVNELERQLGDELRRGNGTQAVRLRRRIKVLDQRAWKMSSDPLLGDDK